MSKRIFFVTKLACFLVVLLATTLTFAATEISEKPFDTLGNYTADAVVSDHGGVLRDILINTDGTNDAAIVLYDNSTTASGKVVWEATCPGQNSNGGVNTCYTRINRRFQSGLYGDMTTSGTMKWNVGKE